MIATTTNMKIYPTVLHKPAFVFFKQGGRDIAFCSSSFSCSMQQQQPPLPTADAASAAADRSFP